MGNVLTTPDRKNQTTTATYDALDRVASITYADSSTVTPTFDAGNRLTNGDDGAPCVLLAHHALSLRTGALCPGR